MADRDHDGQQQRDDRPDEFDADLRKTELRGQQYADDANGQAAQDV